MSQSHNLSADLDARSRAIFREIVDGYLQTGEPVGSRNVAEHLPMTLSPASVRSVMAELESLGLIFAPHTSAGRVPTEQGLRLFVDAILEIGDLAPLERRQIEARIGDSDKDRTVEEVLTEASELISGLSHCAGMVVTDKESARLKHLEFVPLDPGQALAVLVGEDGHIENRIIALPAGLPASALVEATNYLNANIRGMTLSEARTRIEAEHNSRKQELDRLTEKVIQSGLATWSGEAGDRRSLIVRGRSHLLTEMSATEDIERVRQLFDDFESKRELLQIMNLAEGAEGVRIFIGSENKLFSLTGSSLIVAPLEDADSKVVGMLGVVGPTRLNYARIIPMVDYTARLVSKVIS